MLGLMLARCWVESHPKEHTVISPLMVFVSVRPAREAAMWELEERHLQEKHQLFKQQLKDQYFMQRHQLLKRHEKVNVLRSLLRDCLTALPLVVFRRWSRCSATTSA